MAHVFVHLIADYGSGDPAFCEVIQKFKSLRPDFEISPVAVPKFSSLATGLWIYQLSQVHNFPGLSIFSNTAPRIGIAKDDAKTYKGLYGHLAYAKLKNGVPVIAVHMGYTFSFIKDQISEFCLLNVPNAGSQFRSRDFYPDGVVQVLEGNSEVIGEKIPLSSIPDVPASRIGFIDGYGNLKTTNRVSSLQQKPGSRIRIRMNNNIHEAIVGDETYHIQDGQLSYAPGSTGGDDRFMEIWVKGDSAARAFGNPHVETEFYIV